MRTKRYAAAFMAAVMAVSLAACSNDNSSSSAKETAASSAQSEKTEGSAEKLTYSFDRTLKSVEVNGEKFEAYINRPIRFNFNEVPYEEWLAYESPFDEYIELYYDDGSGFYNIYQTTAFAIRYAYENDIEYLDLPLEYSDETIAYGWDYATLSFPNIPDAVTMSTTEYTDDGYTRIELSDSVRKCASSPETLEAAKEIIASMPDDCDTDAKKAYYLYDWVCQNVAYDHYHADNHIGIVNAAPQSAYGALVNKRAVCDGIAGGIQLLFNMAGIDCAKIDANSLDGDSGHVWNVAEIDGEVWDFDATWDIRRYYESDSDEITELDSIGYYEWFGVSRSSKLDQYSLTDVCSVIVPRTSDALTDRSPANSAYDYCINISGDTVDVFKKGELTAADIDTLLADISNTPSGQTITLKFSNDSEMFAMYFCAEEPLFGDTQNMYTITNINTATDIVEITAP